MEEAPNSSTENSRKRKIEKIHHDLKYKLAFEHLDNDSAKKFRFASGFYLSHADRGDFTEPFEIMDKLEAGGHLAPGRYDIIREIGDTIKERNFVAALNDAERQIANIQQSEEKKPLFSSNEKINNIIAQTRREIDLHLSDKSYVCLPVVEHGQKILQQTGLLVFMGPSGCGKTKSVLQILSNVTNGRVLKLQSLRDWPEMVEVKVENWVWFDDVFEHDFIDRNRSMIACIKACIHDGSSKVIFTVTNELYKQSKLLFQKFIPIESIINFEESPYSLCAKMKYKILHSHLRVNDIKIKSGFRPHFNATSDTDGGKEIYESDVQEIPLKKSLLGFPQSCSVFCKHMPFLRKGHHFFDNPSEELLNTIIEMHASEKEQFTALVYTFQNYGELDFGTLDESRVLNMLQSFSASVPRDIEACIRGAVDRLSWKYLSPLSMNVYQFTHSSIYKAVALSYARLSKTTKLHTISLLSSACINDMLKTHLDKVIDYNVIYAGRELFSDLANVLSKRIRTEDYSLFRCDVFSDDEFIKSFIPSYQIQREHVHENLKHVFRYGKVNLAKSMLDSLSLTINDLDDKTFSQILKESSVYNQLLGVKFLIKERRSSPQKIKMIIQCLQCNRQNDEITSYLVHSMPLSELHSMHLQTVSRVVAGDENVKNFKYFISSLTPDRQMDTLQTIAKTIGRRNAKACCDVFLKEFPSKTEELALYVIEGACTGGHNHLIKWAIEEYPEIMKKNAAYLLQHVELPSTLEILDEKYNQIISKLEYSDALNALCAKGKSLCVKVLIDRCEIFSVADIDNAMLAARRKENYGTLNVIVETFSIPHEKKNELVENMRRRIDMRPHSAYPFTPAPTPASVLSKNMFTPCSYEETQKHNNKKWCLKRCLDKQYLSKEVNIYKRAYQLHSLIRDNSVGNDYKREKCDAMLKETPEIYEYLIDDSAVFSCDNEELLSLFLRKYPHIWKRILLSCLDDKKRLKNLLTSIGKQYKHHGQPFLPHLLEYVIKKNENISGFIQLLSEIDCIFDIEEFISALENLIERKTENAEILFQNMEEFTLENKTFVPLQVSCKCNYINAFRFIWSRTGDQEHVFSDFLVNDIVDKNGEALGIMLLDMKSHISIDEVLKKCYDNRASKWISILSRMYEQQFLESVESLISGSCGTEYQASVKEFDISVFKCIWKISEKKQEIFHHFISKDILDKNAEIMKIMMPNSDVVVSVTDVLLKCFRCRAEKWIRALCRAYSEHILDSTDSITLELRRDGDPAVLVLMIKYLNFELRSPKDILLDACENGWKSVIQAVLEKCTYIWGSTIVDSVTKLIRYKHYDLVICFEKYFDDNKLMYTQCDEILKKMALVCSNNEDMLAILRRVVLIPPFASRILRIRTMSAIGIDYIIKHLSLFFKHLEKQFFDFEIYHPIDLAQIFQSLTFQQTNEVLEIILESTSPDFSVHLLSGFLPSCKNIKHETASRIVEFVSARVAGKTKVWFLKYLNTLIYHLLNEFSIFFTDELLLQCVEPMLKGYEYESCVKIRTFELIRERGINCSEFVKFFYEICSQHFMDTSTHKMFEYLIENYLEENQITEGIRICLLQGNIGNREMAKMLMSKVGTSLTFDKSDVFRRICILRNITPDVVECFLELHCNNIDDISLELGIGDLISHDKDFVAESTVIVNTVVGRRVNIASYALSLFTWICTWSRLSNEPSIMLLRYIMEIYVVTIQENVMDGLNEAILCNLVAALEISKAFPRRIVLSEYILYFFLVRINVFEYNSELIRELSNVLSVDSKICAKFVEDWIPREGRWRSLCSLFGSSITEDMIWKLLCLCCEKLPSSFDAERVLEMLSDGGIVLTTQQRRSLEEKYTSPDVKDVLRVFKCTQ